MTLVPANVQPAMHLWDYMIDKGDKAPNPWFAVASCTMDRVSSRVSCNLVYLLAVVTDCERCGGQCAAMDAIKVKHNKTAVNVTPVQCISEFREDTFCGEGDLLRYKMCDMPVHYD